MKNIDAIEKYLDKKKDKTLTLISDGIIISSVLLLIEEQIINDKLRERLINSINNITYSYGKKVFK